MTETIRIERDTRGVARLVLARGDKHNALSGPMIEELHAAADELGRDPAVRVVVLAGEGRSFCAGADLGWMKEQVEAAGPERIDAARRLATMLRALNELPKPLIARVHGATYGGGVGLVAVADVAIAAEGATFALSETRLGLIPATIGPYVVARMGEGKARRVFFSGAVFDARAARGLDLVAEVVAPDALDAAVDRVVEPYLSTAPRAVAAAKRLARSLGPPIDDAVITATVAALAETWEGEEAKAGIAAFFAREKPPWMR